MITRLTLRNFKSVGEQIYDFKMFDLIVGSNNSGKSTILQALAIWQFCVDEFRRSKRKGSSGTQVVLPNFTALPVPEFNLLWKDRTDRHSPERNGTRKQEYILIDIIVEWARNEQTNGNFGVQLRYQSPQTIYAIPIGGMSQFRECESRGDLPEIAYVPPFSGLEPTEKWLDRSPIRQQVGKGQPGSVLRNLLLRVSRDRNASENREPEDWNEIAAAIKQWFSVEIRQPKYNPDSDVNISVDYISNGKFFDVISGGSGFHQTLTLLAFLYGYHPTTILLDEPDAHLHVRLQREILDYFKRKSLERRVQFLITTHAEELVRGVDATQIVSLLTGGPSRVQSTAPVLRAMAEISNEELVRLKSSPFILYVEGESDERILRSWATSLNFVSVLNRYSFHIMAGGSKRHMRESTDRHFEALKEIVPEIKRVALFDFDSEANAFHPMADNISLREWKRKNIENYLLVPDAWVRAAAESLGLTEGDLFLSPYRSIIDNFFASQNLTLPNKANWRTVEANIFQIVDGKRILYTNDNSLFQMLRSQDRPIELPPHIVAASMRPDEVHSDVQEFFGALSAHVGGDSA